MAWIIEGGGVYHIKGDSFWGRNIFVSEDEEQVIRSKFNNTEAYKTYFKYDDKDQLSAKKLGPFIADLDIHINSNRDYNKLKKDVSLIVSTLDNEFRVPRDMIRLYFSGNKGFHIEVPYEIFNIKPDVKLHEKYKAFGGYLRSHTQWLTLDMKIYEYRRLLRMTNTINKETGLFKVPVEYDFLMASTYEDIQAYASMPREVQYKTAHVVPDAEMKFKEFLNKHAINEQERMTTSTRGTFSGEYPPCIKDILERGAVSGQRNATAFALASAILQRGTSLEDTMNQVLDWNREKNVPPSPDGELKSTITSAYVGVNSGRRFGCGGIEILGYCHPTNCKLKANKTQLVKKDGKSGGNNNGNGRRKQRIQ
jgi:hypothetical protein